MMSEDYPDNGLEHVQAQIRDKENDIADLAFDIELSRALADLQGQPAWAKLTETLRSALEAETQKLLSGRMDLYQLGRRQGRIRSMQTLMATKPMDKQELDQKVGALTLLRNEIEELRSLLR